MPSSSEPRSVQISTISMVLRRMPPRLSISAASSLGVCCCALRPHYTANEGDIALAIRAQSNGLDLYKCIAWQFGHRHGRARRRITSEILGVDLVHRAKIAHRRQEY